MTAWKKRLLEAAPNLFGDGRSSKKPEGTADEQQLYEQIGRLKMEVEWLKKNLPRVIAMVRNPIRTA